MHKTVSLSAATKAELQFQLSLVSSCY